MSSNGVELMPNEKVGPGACGQGRHMCRAPPWRRRRRGAGGTAGAPALASHVYVRTCSNLYAHAGMIAHLLRRRCTQASLRPSTTGKGSVRTCRAGQGPAVPPAAGACVRVTWEGAACSGAATLHLLVSLWSLYACGAVEKIARKQLATAPVWPNPHTCAGATSRCPRLTRWVAHGCL